MSKAKQKEYIVWVKRDVLFEAKIKAASIDEALGLANGMGTEKLWSTPGEVIDDAHTITAVFE